MSHEVVQVIKLITYNRKPHEMMSVICKCIQTTMNKEMHKNEHSHEMTRFRNRIAVRSSLHELVLIYGSSHGSVFESPVYRVHNGYEFGCPVTEFGSRERVWNAVTCNKTHREEKESTHTHLIHSRIYPYKHATRAYTSVSYTHLTLPTIYSV